MKKLLALVFILVSLIILSLIPHEELHKAEIIGKMYCEPYVIEWPLYTGKHWITVKQYVPEEYKLIIEGQCGNKIKREIHAVNEEYYYKIRVGEEFDFHQIK